MENVEQMTAAELRLILKEKEKSEREMKERSRKAYVALREDFTEQIMSRALTLSVSVKAFYDFVSSESATWKGIMNEYGQLKDPTQPGFIVRNDKYKVEMKASRVRKFDERADIAADQLRAFLLKWVKNSAKGVDDEMYQLVMTLLERNRYGDLELESVNKLHRMEKRFDDPEYTGIMQLFDESKIYDGMGFNWYFWCRDEFCVWRKIEVSFNRF